MSALDYLENEWVTHLGIGEEPPEATIPKMDGRDRPMVAYKEGRKYLIRKGYFSGKTYVCEVRTDKKDKKAQSDVRAESKAAVEAALEQVKEEAKALRESYRQKKRQES